MGTTKKRNLIDQTNNNSNSNNKMSTKTTNKPQQNMGSLRAPGKTRV